MHLADVTAFSGLLHISVQGRRRSPAASDRCPRLESIGLGRSTRGPSLKTARAKSAAQDVCRTVEMHTRPLRGQKPARRFGSCVSIQVCCPVQVLFAGSVPRSACANTVLSTRQAKRPQQPSPDISALNQQLQQQWDHAANLHLGENVISKFSSKTAY